jgi:uncharacterized protein YciI
MPNFAVTVVHGSGWDASRGIREQDGWDEHAAFMDTLTDEGFVVLGGPLGTGRVLLCVAAADERDVRARLAADPWEPAGLLIVASVEPWALWLDRRRPQADAPQR